MTALFHGLYVCCSVGCHSQHETKKSFLQNSHYTIDLRVKLFCTFSSCFFFSLYTSLVSKCCIWITKNPTSVGVAITLCIWFIKGIHDFVYNVNFHNICSLHVVGVKMLHICKLIACQLKNFPSGNFVFLPP